MHLVQLLSQLVGPPRRAGERSAAAGQGPFFFDRAVHLDGGAGQVVGHGARWAIARQLVIALAGVEGAGRIASPGLGHRPRVNTSQPALGPFAQGGAPADGGPADTGPVPDGTKDDGQGGALSSPPDGHAGAGQDDGARRRRRPGHTRQPIVVRRLFEHA